MKKFFLVVALLAMTFTGCGYTTGSLISSRFRTIFVAPFENKIDYMNQERRTVYIPQLESKVHSAVIDRFMFDGNLRVMEEGNSDLVLKGKVLSFEREELRLTSSEDVKEYRLRVTVALIMWDPVNEKAVWEDPGFSGETTYYTTGSLAKSEGQAIQDVLTDLARRIVERTVEDW